MIRVKYTDQRRQSRTAALQSLFATDVRDLWENPRLEWLDEQIDMYNKQLPPLDEFILPGGTLLASIIHLSRTIARRAETHVIALSQNEEINKDAAIYLNRLSDLMFIMARAINQRKKIDDIVWKP